jgi:O-antigen ligase
LLTLGQFSPIMRSLSRWGVLCMISVSVMLWGGTRPWTGDLIARFLTVTSLCFLASLILPGSRTHRDRKAVACVLLILIPGWLMTLIGFLDSGGVMDPLRSLSSRFPLLPSSVNASLSLRAMILTSGMLGAFLICMDMASSRTWRLRLWTTLCLSGTGMVILGIAQRLTGAQAIYWNLSESHGGYFFSVFRYHANAGAFMNLLFPMMAGLAVRAFWKRELLAGVLWSASLLLTVAAAFVNVSRAAEAITLLLMMATALFLALRFHRRVPGSSLAWIAAFVVLSAVLVSSFGIKKTLGRWSHGIPMASLTGGGFFERDRGLTYRSVALHLLPRTGLWGSGPGTFEPCFASVIKADDLPVKGRWDLAHNDYLQTLSEWGVIPFLAFLALLCGAVARGFLLWNRPDGSSTSLLGLCGALSLSGVLLHALVDFPLQIPSIQLVTSVIAGLLLGSPRAGDQHALRGGNRT